MPRHLISCELNAPESRYERLFDELARLGAKQLMRSQWGLRNAAAAVAIREHLWSFMDRTDRLLVSSLDADWTSQSTITPINEI
jgi:hypothetical protein